jgi:hypothetical protein
VLVVIYKSAAVSYSSILCVTLILLPLPMFPGSACAYSPNAVVWTLLMCSSFEAVLIYLRSYKNKQQRLSMLIIFKAYFDPFQ